MYNYYIYYLMYIENKQTNESMCNWLLFMFWLISIMIVVGGLTRLTDSGLSITKWQLFTGIFPPLNESQWLHYFNLYSSFLKFKNFSISNEDSSKIFL